jgi:molecular chaperone GrpE
VVIRDKRKVRDPAKADTAKPDGAAKPGDPVKTDDPAKVDDAVKTDTSKVDPAMIDDVTADAAKTDPATVEPADLVEKPAPADPGTPLGAELESLRRNVDELTRDLQRMTAEYANYRKRVERDKGLVGEHATGTVLVSLLPVLDDIDRAREHGDLVGPFGSVAEQLVNALTKFGLTPFGEKGDTFDPTRHEAVAHQTSAEVTEPTCVDILRRGYLLGERLLRPALVAVADPQ